MARAIALGTGLEVSDIKITVDRVYCEPDEPAAAPAPPIQPQNVESDEA